MSSHQHRLHVGQRVIEYTLTFAQRKTLTIRVHPDQSVTVKAPTHIEYTDVESFIRKRAPWIVRKQQEFAAAPRPAPRRFVDGELHHYLGCEYRLRLMPAKHEDVQLIGHNLLVWTTDSEDAVHVERMVEGWYLAQAQKLFAARVCVLLPRFAPFSVPRPQIVIRRMKTRWGSCRTNGRISLNLKLMQTPQSCIDYVIVHELCHFVEHNHGPSFYALLARMMPDWSERRQRLNAYPVR